MEIYHNPRCQKSRETLAILEESGKEFTIRRYLDDPPTEDELADIISKLNIKPLELIRDNEKIFKENFKGEKHTDEEWIRIMTENPRLIQRPIVISDDRAVVGRPPENVRELL